MIYALALALLSAYASRRAGDGSDYSALWKLLFGVTFAWACGLMFGSGYEAIGIAAIGAALARAIPLGNAIGPVVAREKPSRWPGDKGPTDPGPEWYQSGVILKSAFLSVLVLGGLRALLLAPVALLYDQKWAFAAGGIGLATVAAPYLAVVIWREPDRRWAGQEWLTVLLAFAPVAVVAITDEALRFWRG